MVSAVHDDLKAVGQLWADHVLENARAYILSFFYIVGTVTTGFPLVTGIARAWVKTGGDDFILYATRFIDSLIYFFLPNIMVTLIRLVQNRNLFHRMTTRTVVIGDIPWVSQCADAFLSKIFARSYSISGLNVLHGNSTDHLVHRNTHRISRGTLLICGRPDGRLTALTSAECSVNLTVNQSSAIQNICGTCESITIGHNPAKLQLTKLDIALESRRPNFLCEQILDVMDKRTARKRQALSYKVNAYASSDDRGGRVYEGKRCKTREVRHNNAPTPLVDRSSHRLKGVYLGLRQESKAGSSTQNVIGSMGHIGEGNRQTKSSTIVESDRTNQLILNDLINEKKRTCEMRSLFINLDTDGNGVIDLQEFIAAYSKVRPSMSPSAIGSLFAEGMSCSCFTTLLVLSVPDPLCPISIHSAQPM